MLTKSASPRGSVKDRVVSGELVDHGHLLRPDLTSHGRVPRMAVKMAPKIVSLRASEAALCQQSYAAA